MENLSQQVRNGTSISKCDIPILECRATIHWACLCLWNSFDGNYPYSFNDLFLRVHHTFHLGVHDILIKRKLSDGYNLQDVQSWQRISSSQSAPEPLLFKQIPAITRLLRNIWGQILRDVVVAGHPLHLHLPWVYKRWKFDITNFFGQTTLSG